MTPIAQSQKLPVYWQHDDCFGVSYCVQGDVDFRRSLPDLQCYLDFEYGSGTYELVEIVSEEQYLQLLDSGAFYVEPF